ncbi:tetratricopeptide repeat protein [Nonomuraea sp. LP-02]|uniref:tetratricopeptide repeat protein n=1 Tax=Nonomuraea sp. LP-02 TaxID=3097960 RepID=UPI002E357A5F|nr:tetratricopeptide repeat protein [Nonomuraea sp. LP-02]MED7928005.1 tetratricopeptide repeat protein [Nonomuraea sp. LP-02]
MTSPPARPDEPPQIRLEATASGHARVIQAARDQFINVHLHGQQEPVRWPHQVGAVPQPAEGFHTRGAEVPLISFGPADGETPDAALVLTGLGGVGKTQWAAHLARTAQAGGAVDLLVWIPATTRQAVVAAYAEAAADVCPGEVADADQAAARFVAWLGRTERRWMVVLDDVSAPADMRDLWPPARAGSATLVTTRRRDAALASQGRRLVELGPFSERQAASYLAHRLGEDPRMLDGAAELAAALGRLPLALAQACAYMLDQDMSCRAYRARLADRSRRLDGLLPESGALPDQQRVTVAAAWSLSVELADQLNPVGLARPALELASVLSPDGIPPELFASTAARDLLAGRGSASEVDAADAQGAVRSLHRLSLVSSVPGRPVQVHGLVQRSVREQLPPEQLARTVRAAADALLQAWPDTEPDFATGQRFRANAEALRSHDEDLLWSDRDVHEVLLRTGQSLARAGLYQATMDHYRQLAATSAQKYGADHPRTLACRTNSIGFLKFTAPPAEAVAAYSELAADCARLYGPDDSATFGVRGNLADVRASGGDMAGALADYEELLVDHRRVWGPHDSRTLSVRARIASLHVDMRDAPRATVLYRELLGDCLTYLEPLDDMTLNIRGKLARLQGEAGDPVGARERFRELLDEHLAAFGRDDYRTLLVRHELAEWRAAAGDPAGAAAELEEMIDDAVRVLGAHHIDVSRARYSLGLLRDEAGDTTAAPAAIGESARLLEQLFGPDHPLVIGNRATLLMWQHALVESDPVAAAEVLKENVAALRALWGPDHPQVLESRRFLLRIGGVIGDPRRTAEEFAVLLADCRRALGPEHLITLTIRADLADWRGEAGDYAGAVADLRDLQGDLVRVLGPHHPETLDARKLLAEKLDAAGDTAGALAVYEDLISLHGHVLSPDHPDTLRLRSALADCRARDAEADTMLPVYQELLADCERVLGPDHPLTLGLRGSLLDCRAEAGDPAGAAEECRELLRDYQRIMPPDHIETLPVRATYAQLLASSEDFAGSVTAYEDLLPAALRIWGPDHLGSLMVRGCLAEVRARRDRAPADGLAAFAALYDDCLRVLGPAHYLTEATRAFLDALRGSGSALPSTTYNKLLDQYAKAERSGRVTPPAAG